MRVEYSIYNLNNILYNEKIDFYNLQYYAFAIPFLNPGYLYITNLNPFFPYFLRTAGNIKVFISNFTTINPVEDKQIINIINSPNGIYGYFTNIVPFGYIFVFPDIPYSSFYDPSTVQGNDLNLYMNYFEFQLPIDIYQLKTENDFIQSNYL